MPGSRARVSQQPINLQIVDQALIWVVVTAAIFRAVLFPDRPAPFAGLKVGMDEVRLVLLTFVYFLLALAAIIASA